MDKDVPCYGCEKRHVEHGYNCHSDCPDYKAFHKERMAKIELQRKKRNEDAMVVETRLCAMRKTSGEKAMQNYVSKEVVCPFYKQEEATKIRCEGFCKSCSLQTSFTRREVLQMHKERHCNSFKGFPKCPLYSVINKQYEEGV